MNVNDEDWEMGSEAYSLQGGTLITPEQIIPAATLTIANGLIMELNSAPTAETCDLRGHLIFPGLINAHDHLNGTWWPRVGPRRPYVNVYEWLADLDESPIRYDRQRNAVEDVYELGVYRNLISGVTTIADHFYRIDGDEFYTRFPVHVLYRYGRTWTPRARTAWGDDIPVEYSLAVRTGQPYIIHLAEGIDHQTAQEMDVLLQLGALGRNTLIIHGISLRPDDMHMMAQVGASVCWCPASNLYLYGQTADIPALLHAGVNVTLGTDSTLTGGLNLLDELRTARRAFREQTGHAPQPRWLVELVTTRAAYALLLEDRRGRIAPGYEADLLVLPHRDGDPYTTLIDSDVADIALLICSGQPVYGDPEYRPLFEKFTPAFTSISVSGQSKLIAGDPLQLISRMSRTVGRAIDFPFLPLGREPGA